MKSATYVLLLFGALLFLGALPLLIYPFVLLASVMSLAGHRSGNEPALLVLVIKSFLLGSIAYPLVYLVCLALAVAKAAKNGCTVALWYGLGPLVYLLFLVGLMGIWFAME
ncbi:MAG: hypothetical protein RBS80_18715 [Thermoguttaceae bacterium]|jgi:hypothetical protein|nr:hypothetical protein [Thermoguttaceae bacterium]